ncbi:MAG: hypothetical protein LBN97_04235 [Oscillospiraceae bacterium]|jgi:hypothetical protein|nr:hypothetical protein [Oscillospiraceae bacterium]
MSKLSDRLLIVVFAVILLSAAIYAADTYGTSAWTSLRTLDRMDNVETWNITAEINAAPEFGEFIRPFDGFWIDLNGLMGRILGQREINDVYKLSNGQLTWHPAPVEFVPNIPAVIAPGVSALTALNEFLTDNGGELLFVLAPSKVSKFENMLSAEAYDPENLEADAFVEALGANGVDYLDLREVFHGLGCDDYAQLFYATDTHWRAETGAFYGYREIVRALENYGWIAAADPQLTDIAAFEKTTYKNFFLGYYGKRVGRYFGGTDDFVVIRPAFETFITTEIPAWNEYIEGDWYEATFIDSMTAKKDYYNVSAYAAYGNSDFGYGIRRNSNAPIDKKLLVIGDSFGNVPFSLLSLIFTEVRELDMRTFNRDYRSFLAEYDPDITIVLTNVNGVYDENVKNVAP